MKVVSTTVYDVEVAKGLARINTDAGVARVEKGSLILKRDGNAIGVFPHEEALWAAGYVEVTDEVEKAEADFNETEDQSEDEINALLAESQADGDDGDDS